MTRRDAYLLDWGLIHTFLGGMTFFAPSPLFPFWAALFIGSGMVAVISAGVRWPKLQVVAFVSLAVAASSRALYHLYVLYGNEEIVDWLLRGEVVVVGSHALGVLLWVGVCAGQVIVSGWRLSDEDLAEVVHDGT